MPETIYKVIKKDGSVAYYTRKSDARRTCGKGDSWQSVSPMEELKLWAEVQTITQKGCDA